VQNGFSAVDRGLTMRVCGAVRLAHCLTTFIAARGAFRLYPTMQRLSRGLVLLNIELRHMTRLVRVTKQVAQMSYGWPGFDWAVQWLVSLLR
jgi:hypothetical protein